ncbi:MAG TPA: hypothetical protein VG148_17610 [Pyrinomonadaceae bacterium]|nr:hypothetical protein [Pyrinomonadaceae bacterium]
MNKVVAVRANDDFSPDLNCGQDYADAVGFQDAEGRDAGDHKERVKRRLQTFAGAF